MTRLKLEQVYEVPRWQDSDGSSLSSFLTSLHFVNPNVGWAVGANQVLRTADGGRTWVNQIIEDMKGLNIPERVFTVDESTAWIITLSRRGARGCYVTRNGGEHWEAQPVPEMLHPNDLFFINSELGWIVSSDGSIPLGDPMIHTTRDSGRSWGTHDLEIKGYARRFKFISPNQGLLVQHTTNEDKTVTICNVLISRDGGANWSVLKSFNRLITDLHMIDENTFFVVGGSGFVGRSEDGGASWRQSYTRQRDCLNTVGFDRHSRGIAAGDFGLMLVSEDKGQHWTSHRCLDDLDNFIDVCFFDNGESILATSRGIFSVTFDS
jgi:photosystem II stability/assembly factor-like uncharacterized protein